MDHYIFEPDDRVMVKLLFRPELVLLSVLSKDDHGLWFDSHDAQSIINDVPVLGFDKPFEHDWSSGYRPSLYVPFTQIEYLLKIRK